MSPLGTNLSRLRHHLAAGAPEIGVHSVSLFALNILRLCVSNVGHIRESKCPISQSKDRESSVCSRGPQTEIACPQTGQT